MILYYFVEFAGSFANIALLLLFIGRLFPKKEPVSKWFYVYVVLMIAGQCALSLFPDWVTQRTIYLLVGGFFLALLFYEVRPWQAVFASGAFFTLIALVEVLAMLLIGLRIPDTDILMQAGAARLVYVVFSNLIQVPLVVLISHFFSRKGNAIRYSSGDIKMGLKQTRKNRAIFTIENPIDSKTEINPARLFERFYTGDASRHNSGTGVGLAVVKLLTDKLGGNVSAEIKSNVLTVTLEIQ